MARSIWTGTIGFGLVQIPVSLHAAEEKDELSMTMLDRRDFSPIGYERVNKRTGKEVAWEDIVKGHEHQKGKYVVLTDADFEAANVESTRQIDILDFVDFSEIDPRYFVRPYYVAPNNKAGKKSYALLREVLKRTNKAGIGKVVLRARQHLAAVVAHEKSLLLVLLRFHDELRNEKDLDLPETNLQKLGITPKEITMAEKLVEGMVEHFKPEKYEDEYRRDLTKLIRQKVKAGEINTVPEGGEEKPRKEKTQAQVIDLYDLLTKSLKGGKQATNGGRGSTKKTARGPAKSRGRRAEGRETHRKSA
jgi:DNA end-binding protein Ku